MAFIPCIVKRQVRVFSSNMYIYLVKLTKYTHAQEVYLHNKANTNDSTKKKKPSLLLSLVLHNLCLKRDSA